MPDSTTLSFNRGSGPVDRSGGSFAGTVQDLRIPFQKCMLDNGLTLIVHENATAAQVSVNIWYRVGSKDEPAGKTGFAHLFEHLMFGGSKHLPGQYLSNLNAVGATGLNGTTNRDRTNYHETVPTSVLDFALFAESDRMGHFAETINQETLDLQRGVVTNEKLQREGGPYGQVWDHITRGCYPPHHPYGHTTIGSFEDIEGAKLEDVRAWFKNYYGPNNAVICLAGDIDFETAKAKVTQYFGDIPPGPPLTRPGTWINKMQGVRRQILEDRVPLARLYLVWNTPEYGHVDDARLDLVAAVLSSGINSRLRKRLEYDEKLVTDVSANQSSASIGSQFTISATVKPGVDVAMVERILHVELKRLQATAPSEAELERVKFAAYASQVRLRDDPARIADLLNMSEIQLGSPDAYLRGLEGWMKATPEDVRDAAARWLSDGMYALTVLPAATHSATGSGVDRSRAPSIGAPVAPRLPELQRDSLSNGLKIVLAERHHVPVVNCSMLFQVGQANEAPRAAGVARLLFGLLPSGAGERNALQLNDELQRLAASITANVTQEWSDVGLSTLKAQLNQSLAIYADVIQRPRLDPEDFSRRQARQIERIAQEVSSAGSAPDRLLPGLLFGREHVLAKPLSGRGLRSTVSGLTRDEVAAFHATWVRPELATLVIVGDTTLAEMKPKLEKLFGGWATRNAAPLSIPGLTRAAQAAVYLIDKPGVPQTTLLAATMLPPEADMRRRIAMGLLNNVLGADFSSRINMNLREDKHWCYGANTKMTNMNAVGRLLTCSTSVQLDRTADAMREIYGEYRDILRDRPVTQAEIDRVKRYVGFRIGAKGAHLGGLMGAIGDLLRHQRPDDYWTRYVEELQQVTVADVDAIAPELLDPERLVWIVAGDLERIEPQIRASGFGPLKVIEADGEALYAGGAS